MATAEPKQARAHATRQKLLDAAVAELLEVGYGGLTTVGVAQRAGVSRGGQQNHFPLKHVLVAEAVAHLATRLGVELDAAVQAAPQGRTRLRVALDILFEQYSGPLFAAVVELSLAARRAEPELLDAIRVQERAISRAIHDTASTIFGPEAVEEPGFAERWSTVLATVRGLAMLKLFGYPAVAVDRQWEATRADLVELLPL